MTVQSIYSRTREHPHKQKFIILIILPVIQFSKRICEIVEDNLITCFMLIIKITANLERRHDLKQHSCTVKKF